jgi:isopentenyldiphosphate isomerase
MAEKIDVFDANLSHLGVMDRGEAHREGMWHKTFHCWVVSHANGGSVLYQRRSHQMANFPDLLDVSAAGHLEAGETTEQGVREVFEELGISADEDAFQFLGFRVEVADQKNGQKNREYQAVHMILLDKSLADYRPQETEVAGLYWLPVDAGIRLFSGAQDRADTSGIAYGGRPGLWKPHTLTVSVEDFLPRIQNYYLTAHIMAERLLARKLPLAIS